MNIDDLTIGEAKRLATLLAGFAPATLALTAECAPVDLAPERIGKVVLVRSRGSGVWIGTLAGRSVSAAGHSVALTGARRIWSWTGAAECSQLAMMGPRGGIPRERLGLRA